MACYPEAMLTPCLVRRWFGLSCAWFAASACAPAATSTDSDAAVTLGTDAARYDGHEGGPTGSDATAEGGGDGAGGCRAPLATCGQDCVDLSAARDHCGQCGAACGDEEVCAGGTCAPLPPSCIALGCPAGAYCDVGADRCAVGCQTDTNCSARQICLANQCVTGCRSSEACAGDEVCEALVCRPACRSDDDCPLETRCEPSTRRCVEGCSADTRCPDGEVCDAGGCRDGCRAETDCEFGTVCDADDRICRVGCRADAGCPAAQICRAGACSAGCREGRPCPAEHYCELTDYSIGAMLDGGAAGTCRPGCVDDSRCPQGSICRDPRFECAPGCRADSDCALGDHCDATSLLCTAGCHDDPTRCAVGQACVDGTCSRACADEGGVAVCHGDGYTCVWGNSLFGAITSRCLRPCDTSADCGDEAVCQRFAHEVDLVVQAGAACSPRCQGDSSCVASVAPEVSGSVDVHGCGCRASTGRCEAWVDDWPEGFYVECYQPLWSF